MLTRNVTRINPENSTGSGITASTLITGKTIQVKTLLQMRNLSEKEGDMFEGLSHIDEDGSITFVANHSVLDGHFGNENGGDVRIIPGVYLRSLAFVEYQRNGGNSPMEGLKFNFIGMIVPNDTLIWDIERKGFYKSYDISKSLCIQIEEVIPVENPILLMPLNDTMSSKPQEIPATELDTYLPQKPPFRFAEKYIAFDETNILGSMQIRNPNQINGTILEEFAAQTMSYHKSKGGNPEGFRTGTIGTFASSQTHFDNDQISKIAINSAIYVVGRLRIEEDERVVNGGNKPGKKNITNIMEYSLFDANGTLIGFGKLTGTIMNWKTFQKIRTKVGALNTIVE